MIKRIIFNELQCDLKRREISILIGPRQVGKTTLLKEILRYCRDQGEPLIGYMDLEQPAEASFFARSLDEILRELRGKKGVLLIDEFHYIPNATRLFKAIYDGCPGIKIFATGSSSLEMHKHLKESLAGRRRLHLIHPLTFREFLQATDLSFFPRSLEEEVPSSLREAWRKHWNHFVLFGGLPGLVQETVNDNKKRLLVEYVGTYVQKDVKALLREEDVLVFNKLLVLLADRSAHLLNESRLASDLKHSPRQVRKELQILNLTYLLDLLSPYSTNRSTEIKKTQKPYLYDLGIRHVLLNDFSPLEERIDKGIILETAVYQELKKHLQVTQQIYYWRTKQKEEVDFILVKDRKPLPIEVKGRLDRPDPPKGLLMFLKRYPAVSRAVVLNESIQTKLKLGGQEILFVPHSYAGLIPGRIV